MRPTRCDSGADGIVRMEETEGVSMNNAIDSKKIALTALFTAASLVLSFVQIPLFPAAPWLMYDPSGIACLIAAMAFGPKVGAVVAIVSWLPRVFLDPFGAPMGMLSTCTFIIPAALIYRSRNRSRSSALAGMLAGAALSIALSCAMNLVVTPLYTAISVEQVAGMIIPILLPFNFLKMVVNVIAGQVLLTPCMNVLEAQSGIDA
jgi:riboflavin transporter FmnP